MNKYSKKILIICVIVLVIVALVIILMTFFGNSDSSSSDINPYTNEAYLTEEEVQEKIENMDIYENLDIVVNNLYDFVKIYEGDLATKDYTDYIKNLNSKFKELYKETSTLSESELTEYFEENKADILEDYGIETTEGFDQLIEYIAIYETSGLTYSDVTLEKDTAVDEGDYVKTQINITYSNDITQTIYVSVLKDTSTDLPEFVLGF